MAVAFFSFVILVGTCRTDVCFCRKSSKQNRKKGTMTVWRRVAFPKCLHPVLDFLQSLWYNDTIDGLYIESYPKTKKFRPKGGDRLAKDMIEKIKQAEEQAQQIRERAQADAKKVLQEAEEHGKALCEWAESEGISENKEKIRLIRERADQMMAHNQNQAEQQAAAISADAELRMREAVRLILGGVMEQCQ